MVAALLVLALPFLMKRVVAPHARMSGIGFIPPAVASKGMSFAKSQMAPKPAGGAKGAPAAGPSPMAMAALGPAALLTTPQGKAGVAKGITLLKSAAKGNPKSKARVKQIKRDAARGNPKAQQEMAALEAAQMVQDEADEMDEDEELESDDLSGDYWV